MPRTLYQKIREIWKDKPDKSTPLLAEDLMHIEQGIYDNSANIIDLGEIADGLGTLDITNQCTITASGRKVTITVPLSTLLAGSAEIIGGEFVGIINFGGSRPPMLFNLFVSATSKTGDRKPISKAVLINLYSSLTQYGDVFDGVVDDGFIQLQSAMVTFDLGTDVSITSGQQSTIYRTGASAVDFSISQIYDDLLNKIKELNPTGPTDTADVATETDITTQCSVAADGQKLVVTVPISGTVVSLQGTECIAGGSFLGKIILGSIPPLLLNADISVVKYQNNSFDVSGIAHLTNTYKSTNPQYGTVLKGSIEVGSLSQTSVNECRGTAKLTFEFDSELMVNAFIIYKSLRYYPIAQLWSDMTEKIKTLEQRVEVLEQQAGHI